MKVASPNTADFREIWFWCCAGYISAVSAYISALGNQLKSILLCSVNVTGDGNCMLRALSMSMFGHENEHGILRAAIARHMELSQ